MIQTFWISYSIPDFYLTKVYLETKLILGKLLFKFL